jgi:hypothetical protein
MADDDNDGTDDEGDGGKDDDNRKINDPLTDRDADPPQKPWGEGPDQD